MAKKVKQKFDAQELHELTKRLKAHHQKLVGIIAACPKMASFDEACVIRDASQYLVTTCLTIEFIASTLLKLAEMDGPLSVPHLDDCGLDWNPDEQ